MFSVLQGILCLILGSFSLKEPFLPFGSARQQEKGEESAQEYLMPLAGFYFRLLDLLGMNKTDSTLELILGFKRELSSHFPNSKI